LERADVAGFVLEEFSEEEVGVILERLGIKKGKGKGPGGGGGDGGNGCLEAVVEGWIRRRVFKFTRD
jgi:hypothetical protein